MRVIFFASLMLLTASASAEIFRWTDASGNTVFGDSPPKAAKVDQVKLPLLTVADGYGKKEEKNPPAEAKAPEGNGESAESGSKKPVESSRKDKSSASEETSAETGQAYSHFSIKSPVADEIVRANDGGLIVQLDVQPSLKSGYGVVFYLDGKQVGSSSSPAISLENISRGAHSVFAVLHDAKKRVLTNTESVNFTVLKGGH